MTKVDGETRARARDVHLASVCGWQGPTKVLTRDCLAVTSVPCCERARQGRVCPVRAAPYSEEVSCAQRSERGGVESEPRQL